MYVLYVETRTQKLLSCVNILHNYYTKSFFIIQLFVLRFYDQPTTNGKERGKMIFPKNKKILTIRNMTGIM